MKSTHFAIMSLAIALPQAQAQQPSTATTVPAPTGSDSQTAFDALPGRWVRVEGGYVITIKAIDAEGKLDASYENPRLLPFYSAVATKDGTASKDTSKVTGSKSGTAPAGSAAKTTGNHDKGA